MRALLPCPCCGEPNVEYSDCACGDFVVMCPSCNFKRNANQEIMGPSSGIVEPHSLNKEDLC